MAWTTAGCLISWSSLDSNFCELTRIDAVESGLNNIVELHDESSGFREEWGVSSNVLDVCPDYTISDSWLRCTGAPNL